MLVLLTNDLVKNESRPAFFVLQTTGPWAVFSCRARPAVAPLENNFPFERGLRRRVKSSSKVSSLSMTRRNLLRHRSTRFCFCFSTAMIKDKYRALNFFRGVK